jgi:nucleoid DNA-binding protein
MINTTDFCREFAKTYGVSIKYSETIVNSVFEFLGHKLFEDGEDVLIRRFGTFKHKKMAEKNVRHPGTGEMMTMPERDVVKFTRSETGVPTAE